MKAIITRIMTKSLLNSEEVPSICLPARRGYKRVYKRTRDQSLIWFYRFVSEPIFDKKTHFKLWCFVLERWDVYPLDLQDPDIIRTSFSVISRTKSVGSMVMSEIIIKQSGIIKTTGTTFERTFHLYFIVYIHSSLVTLLHFSTVET